MLERVWRKGNPLTLLVGMQTSTAAMENSVEIPLKTGNRTRHMNQQSHYWTYTLRKPVLKETHGMCLHIPCAEVAAMFIAALFMIARTWKQPRCPSADEWIRKLWYIYIMECYSAIKKNSFESVLMRWIKLEPIIQSEVSQKDKDHYSILTHIYGI